MKTKLGCVRTDHDDSQIRYCGQTCKIVTACCLLKYGPFKILPDNTRTIRSLLFKTRVQFVSSATVLSSNKRK